MLRADPNGIADLVPVDFVNNMLLSIGWITAMYQYVPSPSFMNISLFFVVCGTPSILYTLKVCRLCVLILYGVQGCEGTANVVVSDWLQVISYLEILCTIKKEEDIVWKSSMVQEYS